MTSPGVTQVVMTLHCASSSRGRLRTSSSLGSKTARPRDAQPAAAVRSSASSELATLRSGDDWPDDSARDRTNSLEAARVRESAASLAWQVKLGCSLRGATEQAPALTEWAIGAGQ